jgi:hypothetical protein
MSPSHLEWIMVSSCAYRKRDTGRVDVTQLPSTPCFDSGLRNQIPRVHVPHFILTLACDEVYTFVPKYLILKRKE